MKSRTLLERDDLELNRCGIEAVSARRGRAAHGRNLRANDVHDGRPRGTTLESPASTIVPRRLPGC